MEKKAMRAKDVMAYLSISRSLLRGLTLNDDNFPKPTKITSRCVVWDKAEIDDWLSWKSKRMEPVKKKSGGRADLAGQKVNMLTVIEDTGERINGAAVWLCGCECGNRIKVQSSKLISQKAKSCGCIRGSHLKANYECLNGVS